MKKIVEILNKGGIIVYPTDTVYGIGCLINYSNSVEKIFKIKNRAKSEPLLIMIKDLEMLREYKSFNKEEERIILKNIKKPISFVIKIKEGKIDGIINNNGDTVGVRFANTRFLKKLFKYIQYPLITTSANVSGKPSTNKFKQLDPLILDKVELVIKGRNMSGKPSQIIDLTTGEILRK